MSGELAAAMNDAERADALPTQATLDSYESAWREFNDLAARWAAIKTTDLPALNAQLKQAGQTEIVLKPIPVEDPIFNFGNEDEDEG